MANAAGDGRELCNRLGYKTARRLLSAHLVGAVLAAMSGALTSASIKGHGWGFEPLEFAVLGGYLAVAGIAGMLAGSGSYDRALAWLQDDRPPTKEERRLTLGLPWRLAAQGLTFWLVAALIWGVLDGFYYDNGTAYSVRVSMSIVLGGLAVSALSYLLVERISRPVVALALKGDVPERAGALGVKTRLMLSWALGADVFLIMIGLTFYGRPRSQPPSAASIWFIVDAGLISGTAVLYVAARSLADPLRVLRRAVGQVQQGDLDVEVPVDDGGEVGLLQAGFNQMVVGLRERRRLEDLFGRHVGSEVVRQAVERGVHLGGERREVSVLFVDVIGSTALAQKHPPDRVVDLLNQFFGTVVTVVAAEGGWVNKFEGDGALCVFGAPVALPDHALRALRAARTIRRDLLALSAVSPDLDAAIGVSAGVVVAGNVGAEQRYEYTVIGDAVNEAARLTDEAKQRLGRVLASEEAVARAGRESGTWMVADEILLRGRQQPTLVYEPAALSSVDSV
jgi:adenylate cyclase